MDLDNPEDTNAVYAAIGYAVSCLIESGKPLERDHLLAQLRQIEKQSVDGMKKIYAEALQMVASEKF